MLAVHHMLFNIVRLYRAKCPQANMQGNPHNVNAFFFNGGQQLRGKMKTRSGRRCGTVFSGIYRLIPLFIFQLGFDVVRKGHGPQLLQKLQKNTLVRKLQDAVSVRQYLLHHGGQLSVSKDHLGACAHLFAWEHDAFPPIPFQVFQKQNFYRCAGFLFGSVESGRNHAGVVNHQTVSRLQLIQNIIKMQILGGAGDSIQCHQPGMIPLGERCLGDQLLRKIIVKIGFFHTYPSFALNL